VQDKVSALKCYLIDRCPQLNAYVQKFRLEKLVPETEAEELQFVTSRVSSFASWSMQAWYFFSMDLAYA